MSPPIYTHIYTHIYILEGKRKKEGSPGLWPSVSSRLIQPDDGERFLSFHVVYFCIFIFSRYLYRLSLGFETGFFFFFFLSPVPFILLLLLLQYILYKLALSPSFLFSRLYQRYTFCFRSMSSFSTHRRKHPTFENGTLKKEKKMKRNVLFIFLTVVFFNFIEPAVFSRFVYYI